MTCQLYRHFDENGELLYVGISLGAVSRLSQHKASPWFDQIKKVEIQKCTDRQEALALEATAIQSEKPKYNKNGIDRIPPDPDKIRKRLEKQERRNAEIAALLAAEKAALAKSQIYVPLKPREDMTELERASTDFLKAILNASREILGHTQINFKIDATISTKPEDAERGRVIGARIQEALNVASRAVRPVTIEGTTAQ